MFFGQPCGLLPLERLLAAGVPFVYIIASYLPVVKENFPGGPPGDVRAGCFFPEAVQNLPQERLGCISRRSPSANHRSVLSQLERKIEPLFGWPSPTHKASISFTLQWFSAIIILVEIHCSAYGRKDGCPHSRKVRIGGVCKALAGNPSRRGCYISLRASSRLSVSWVLSQVSLPLCYICTTSMEERSEPSA